MSIFLWIVLGVLVIALAITAQYYRILGEKLLEYALYQEQWIDDIIKALTSSEDIDPSADYLIKAKKALGKGPLD